MPAATRPLEIPQEDNRGAMAADLAVEVEDQGRVGAASAVHLSHPSATARGHFAAATSTMW